jgi:hypothetical protein
MKTIYKYPIPFKDKFSIDLPKHALIIRVDTVDGNSFLWAIHDTDNELMTRHFECYKTGQEIITPLAHLYYLGTCKIFIGQELCLYVFENIIKSYNEVR